MGVFFGVAKISNIFFGCLKFLIFLGVNGRSGWVVTWFLLGYTVRMFEYTVRTF